MKATKIVLVELFVYNKIGKYSYMIQIYILTHDKCILSTQLKSDGNKCLRSTFHYLQRVMPNI